MHVRALRLHRKENLLNNHVVFSLLFNAICLSGFSKWNESKLCQQAQRQDWNPAQSVICPTYLPGLQSSGQVAYWCIYGMCDCKVPIFVVVLCSLPFFMCLL